MEVAPEGNGEQGEVHEQAVGRVVRRLPSKCERREESLIDNDLTDFQRLTILMDVFRKVPELDFRGYADYVRSRVPAVVK